MKFNPLKNSCYRFDNSDGFIPIPKEPHNTNMKNSAYRNASYMVLNPSHLEKMMMEFLDNHKIKYEFQKPLFMKSKGGFIKNYYIVDFFIPKKHLIIEVDGKFHDDQKEYDAFRTKDIQKHYPKMKVGRWRYADFSSYEKMKKLLKYLQS